MRLPFLPLRYATGAPAVPGIAGRETSASRITTIKRIEMGFYWRVSPAVLAENILRNQLHVHVHARALTHHERGREGRGTLRHSI